MNCSVKKEQKKKEILHVETKYSLLEIPIVSLNIKDRIEKKVTSYEYRLEVYVFLF